jgi:hypothetical protein
MSLVTFGMGDEGGLICFGMGGGILTKIYRKILNLISLIRR